MEKKRGIESVRLEMFLVSIGQNLYKFQNKKEKNNSCRIREKKVKAYGVRGVMLFYK